MNPQRCLRLIFFRCSDFRAIPTRSTAMNVRTNVYYKDYFLSAECVWDVPGVFFVCHGSSLHVPEQLIGVGAWHRKNHDGRGAGKGVTAQAWDCPKLADLIRITAIISLSIVISLQWPPTPLFLQLFPHPSITILALHQKKTQKKNKPRAPAGCSVAMAI